MNRFLIGLLLRVLSLVWLSTSAYAALASKLCDPSTPGSWSTNGPVVFQSRIVTVQALPGAPLAFYPPPNELPPELRRDMLTFLVAANITAVKAASNMWDHFLPDSLNNLVWTNFLAQSSGKNMLVWRVRSHPPGWPTQPPVAEWNPKCLMAGMAGITALSPCWEQEGSSGQMPITALTRRHGYTRGHDMGGDRFGTVFAGKKVWFLSAQNTVVQTTVSREVVRTKGLSGRDYTILLFNSDLPDTIQPMRVVPENGIFGIPNTRYVQAAGGTPSPILKTEQLGFVSADVLGFNADTYKPGDSGSPNMLPLPGELAFWTGRSTSGASPEMQADMDQLCKLEGLDPRKYQLQWVDLSRFPTY